MADCYESLESSKKGIAGSYSASPFAILRSSIAVGNRLTRSIPYRSIACGAKSSGRPHPGSLNLSSTCFAVGADGIVAGCWNISTAVLRMLGSVISGGPNGNKIKLNIRGRSNINMSGLKE